MKMPTNVRTPEPIPEWSVRAKARWRKAIWYVTQEAKKKRALRSSILKRSFKLCQSQSPPTPSIVSVFRRRSSFSTKSPAKGYFKGRKNSAVLLQNVKEAKSGQLFLSSASDISPAHKEAMEASVSSSSFSMNRLRHFYMTDVCEEIPSVLNSSMYILACWGATCFVTFVPDLHQFFYAGSSSLLTQMVQSCWILFALDFIMRSLCQDKFVGSMYFILDAISIISLLPDVIGHELSGFLLYFPLRIMVLARSWQTARAGSHMASFLGLYIDRTRSDSSFPLNVLGVRWETQDESKIDHELDRSIVKRCCATVGCLVLLLCLQAAMVPPMEKRLTQDLRMLGTSFYYGANANVKNRAFAPIVSSYLQEYSRANLEVVYLELAGVKVYGDKTRIESLRMYPAEGVQTCLVDEKLGKCCVHLDQRELARSSAGFRLLTAFVVTFVLFFSSWSLAGLLRRKIIRPLDNIASKIRKMVDDPLQPLSCDRHTQPQMKKIEYGLFSLARLLQLGFGEAGARVISRTLASGTISALDTNKPGSIVNAFFGFCDIRNFTSLTEVLQADVVKLVNGVARRLHDSVVEFHGDPNKNIGDAFLVVWKPKKGIETIQDVADAALKSYIQCMLEIARDTKLNAQISRPAVQERMPGFTIRMGFGLHFGWAVECVIGSKHKVDVSYLSPDVNMSSRLEAATKQYGVSILMSGDVVGLLSTDAQRLCRRVDRVTVKGSKSPIDLYTFDEPTLVSQGGTVPDDVDFSSIRSNQSFFSVVRPRTTSEFRKEFEQAISLYLGGIDGSLADWEEAQVRLDRCLEMEPFDGPTRAIKTYIEEASVIPKEMRKRWKGYRALEEK